jgi:transposase
VRATLRRLRCPTHGILVEGVPFARPGSRFTTDFEDLIAYLATKTDKTTITRLQRVDWDTVGRICERVVADGLDPARLDGLVSIGVDEVSWRRRHNYLTLITDHTGKKIVWGAPGKDAATLDEFFADLGAERADRLQAISMDMGAAFLKSATHNALNAVRCIDPFHAVQLVTDARPGTSCASYRTRTLPRRSRAPAGSCSNAPRTSPRTRPRRCGGCATAAVQCGGPTA